MAASRIQAKGILRHYEYGGWAHGFAFGDAVRVLFYEGDFIEAHETYWDADWVWVAIRLTDVTIVVGKPGAVGTDEFDRFP